MRQAARKKHGPWRAVDWNSASLPLLDHRQLPLAGVVDGFGENAGGFLVGVKADS